jgi:hypothetical protein
MKEKLEILEKFIIVLTMVGGLIASTYKGYEYITAKTLVVEAKAAQEKEIGNAQQLLTKTYSDLLKNLDNDIRELDNRLEKEVYEGTIGWDKLNLIREQKVNDRNKLLTTLGEQVSNFKNQPNKIK